MVRRTRALLEVVGGLLLFGTGAAVLGHAETLLAEVRSVPQASLLGEPVLDAIAGGNLAARPFPTPVQTLKESEPPPSVGEAFDEERALPAAARAVASYTLSARLDDTAHTIEGHGTIEWENASEKPATELYFHLYLNAFKNSRTVFLRAPFGGGRSGHGATHWGYIDVKRLAVREFGDKNVWPAPGTAGTPGAEDPNDETDVRVPLPEPVRPGGKITLDVEWHSTLPEIVERTGYARDFHMMGQWFPKIAQRSPEGVWVHFPFHAQSEFYADFGTYDVTLDVAKDLVVGATGSRTEDRVEGARRKLRYHADSVHDFAWTAWKSFLERTETMDGVHVRLLYPPGNDANADATLRAVRHGLRHYGALFGRYPYPVLTVVHPPEFAPGAGGMEYPTLITTGFPWYTSLASNFVERVTLHELGHQWFYGLVATDEHAWPFL
ncbi:MAG TPA: M1 family metallopeptidase, partial [Polyangiaceae bacterium]